MNEVETATVAPDAGPALFEAAADEDTQLLGLPNWESLPYPGLRAFRRDEMEIFFGRETTLDSMVDRLAQTKFLAVLGPSGCGKSSLVRTGLYNALELGFLPNAGGHWKIAELNPGRQPLRNLARAIAEIMLVLRPVKEEQDAIAVEDLIAAHLRRGPRSVVELGEGGLLADGGNLLIVVDQFEELFRFRDFADREDAEAFVALLLESASSALPIHIVITMRSEYVGACSLIPGLAEQISEGMFLTPRMTREECRQAIEGPSGIRGFDIEPELVARILNDLQSFSAFDRGEGLDQADQLSLQADQLPLMQHMLNRIWRHAVTAHRPAAGRLKLTLHDYDEVRGLTGALDDHGKEILGELEAELGPDGARTTERVFRALVEGSSLPLAVRRPRTLDELVAAAGGEEKREDVKNVVEAFRGRDRNFLRTSDAVLDGDVVVDLGHESLIRRWSCLREWFTAEVESCAIWQRLSQDAALRDSSEGGLLRDLGLRRLSDWWEAEKPTPYIAVRYGGDFEKARSFLAASAAAQERRKKVEQRTRIGLRVAGLAVIVALTVLSSRMYSALSDAERAQSALLHEKGKAERAAKNFDFVAGVASRYAIGSLALRESFAQRYCREFPLDSTQSQRCVDALMALRVQTYLANRLHQFGGQLPSAGSGPAGGAIK